MYRLIVLSLLGWMGGSLFAQNGLAREEKPGRLLIVSGGGATGAWGSGVTQAMYEDSSYVYEAVIGSSTGSLIAPFVLTQSFAELKEGYTNITDKDIFSVRPFKTKGPKAGKLRTFNAIWRIITQRKTLGESKKLLKTIRKFFTQEDFDALKANRDCEFLVTVVNVLHDQVEYKSIHDPELGLDEDGQYDPELAYETYTEWIWASANFPVFMSLHDVRDENNDRLYYFDGGIKESIPLEKGLELAREKGIRNIDVIIHSTREPQSTDSTKVVPALNLLGKTIDLFRSEIRENDVKLSKAIGKIELRTFKQDPIDITVYYMSKGDYNSIPNQLVFNQDKMNQLWENGTKIYEPERYNTQVIKFSIDDDELLRRILFAPAPALPAFSQDPSKK